ncbi:MAG: leucine-rich repeat protein [Prevotella sp.]
MLNDNLETIGWGGAYMGTEGRAFEGCKSLQSIKIPSKIKVIPSYTFNGCTSLEYVELPFGLQTIGSNAFNNTKISSIYLPESLMSIGESAFSGAINLQNVIVRNGNVIEIKDNTFSYNTYLTGNLYVPYGCKEAYKNSTSGWCNFEFIIEGEMENDNASFYFHIVTSTGGIVNVLGSTLSNTSMSATVKAGDDVTLSFTPDNGYELKSLEVNGVDVTNKVVNNSYTISSVNQNTSIVVTFAALPVYLTIKSADNGSIAQEVEKGKVYSFVITPNKGWNIESVSFNGKNVTSQLDGNKYTTQPITSDSELNIVYKQDASNGVKALYSECNIRLSASSGKLTIENSGSATSLSVFTLSGTKVASESISTGTNILDLPTDHIYIVKVGKDTFKVSM